jgi:hypothetical protein
VPPFHPLRNRNYVPCLVIGGVAATVAQAEQAADALEAWPSTTIRPVLRPLGNPLALCDYHAAAAPYRHLFASRAGRRGASGCPVTKLAFIRALRGAVTTAKGNPAALYSAVVAQALEAFARDESYAAEIARAAVAQSRARYSAALRARLRQAVHRAVSACDAHRGEFACTVGAQGTGYCGVGQCRFANGDLAGLEVTAAPGRLSWPANSAHAGLGFDPSGAMPLFLSARPFTVAVKVSSHDQARARDEAAA